MNFTMIKDNKAFKITVPILCILPWVAAWEILARIIDLPFVLPTVADTLKELVSLFGTWDFYAKVFLSFARISVGFILGVVLGIAFAFLTHYSTIARALLRPLLTVLKATPVASFIMVLWLLIGSSLVPSFIAVIMVAPIVWQNLDEGFLAIDKNLDEVCEIFSVSKKKRIKILVIPTLVKYLIPSLLASAGLSWKAGVAAEIISYTNNSIGKEIYQAKAFFEAEKMFAWTIIVIILSISIEKLLKYLKKRFVTGPNQYG